MCLNDLTISWFTSYLSGWKQAVFADGVRSSSLVIDKGVPQGSILRPLLFTLYINNMLLPSLNCNVHYYTDDTILYNSGPTLASAVAGLQTAFVTNKRPLKCIKLILNSKKTKWMLFSRSPRVYTSLGIHTLQGEQIEIVNYYKYLGIWLDTKLSFRTHGEHFLKELRRKIASRIEISLASLSPLGRPLCNRY